MSLVKDFNFCINKLTKIKMQDDELQMLLKEFMSVQQQKTNPLAQRTVAEIMVKLHHSGFRFFSTTDGNEYVTPERLDQQIIDLIIERGHVNIGILPQILNIGIDTIEGRVIKLLTKYSSESTNVNSGNNLSHSRIFRHNSLLLSEKYLMSILENIRQTLVLQGKVNLETIALDNQFNIKFTEKLVKQNIEFLNAELINNQLITKEYNLMRKLQLLGYLRAINNPISFENILKNSKLAQNDESRTLEKLLHQVIQEKKVKGKYQNSYYIPESFIVNQKQRIFEFFSSNGFIEFEMLQKQFLVQNPEEWLQKNLSQSKEFAGKFVIFEEVCILTQKLNFFAHNIVQQLNHEGFIEISQLLPFTLQEKELDRFLNEYCKLKDYFAFEGYCYSDQWLSKVMDQFKEKVFKSIFANTQQGAGKNDPKNAKKKGGKKDTKSVKMVEQDQLIEKLYNEGLAEYSIAENIAPTLIPILTKKLEQQKKKYEKELAQNKGILNNSFLKYRSCNTIMRNIDGLQRNLNIIEKQKKKNNESWTDKDFGPNQNDEKGIYSVIYYDNILPKGWPTLQEILKWQSAGINIDHGLQTSLTSQGCLFGQVLTVIQNFNKNFISTSEAIQSPLNLPKQIEKSNNQCPFAFGFYRNQNDRRYVIVDDKLPFVNDKLLGYSGIRGFAEKAYAKFRYCYKGIMNLSFKILLLEMTGKQPLLCTFEKNNEKEIIEIISTSLKENKMIICMAEGETGKSYRVEPKEGQQNVEISYMRPYLCTRREEQQNEVSFNVMRSQWGQIKNNQGQKLASNQFAKIFKNIYIL